MKVICANCGKEIEKTPSQVKIYKNHFCSLKCRDEFKIKRVKLTCKYCGRAFERIPSHIGSHGSVNSYCSKRCSELDRIENIHLPTKKSWEAMIRRCNNENDISYKNYGGRGITVCKQWEVYENFFKDMGPRPTGMSLDRINVNKGYSPNNCRWATYKEQARNTRSNRRVKYKGEEKCLVEWCEIFGLKYSKAWSEITRRGKSLEQVIAHENYCRS